MEMEMGIMLDWGGNMVPLDAPRWKGRRRRSGDEGRYCFLGVAVLVLI